MSLNTLSKQAKMTTEVPVLQGAVNVEKPILLHSICA